MHRLSYRELLPLLLVIAVAIFLWGLIFFSINARYNHFAEFGVVENQALMPDPSEQPDGADRSEVARSAINQMGRPGYFWSESAFHFRTTLMYAVDWYQNPEVLNRDRWQQYPQGVNSWSHYYLFMEPLLGSMYRILGSDQQGLIQFLMKVLPLLHVLLLLPLYILARWLCGDSRFALIGVLVFSTCSLGFSPLLSNLYVKETLSWLLFSGFLVGHFGYLHTGKQRWLGVGTVFLALFLMSWHLAQFVTVPVMLVGMAIQVDSGKTGRFPRPMLQPLMYWAAFLVVGFSTWVRWGDFVYNAPAMLPLIWAAMTSIPSSRLFRFETRKARLSALSLVGILILAVAAVSSRMGGDYSHLGGLLWSRIIHCFQKPVDPGELPFAVRVFWVAPFSSPRWAALKSGLGINGILLVAATVLIFIRSFRQGISIFEKSFVWCTFLYFLVFMFVERLAPLFIFFGAGIIPLWAVYLNRELKLGSIRKLILPAMMIFPLVSLFSGMGAMVQVAQASLTGNTISLRQWDRQWDSSREKLFSWIRDNTPGEGFSGSERSASFVGEIGVSPQLLLYAGRPVVLNSQFENEEIRLRYKEYLEALFSENREDLIRFSQKYKVDYLFINRDWATAMGRNTPRYLAGKTGPGSLKWNISQLHFFPLSLDHFVPVYENDHYRVFAFSEAAEQTDDFSWTRTYGKWWKIENFSRNGESLSDPVNDRAALSRLDRMFVLLPERLGRLAGDLENARGSAGLQSAPRENLMTLQKQLAWFRFESLSEGRPPEENLKVKKLENEIGNRLAEVNLRSGLSMKEALLEILNGSQNSGEGVLKALAPFECSPGEYSLVAQILVLLGEFEVAGEFFGKAGMQYPKPALTKQESEKRPSRIQEELWQDTVLFLMAGDNQKKARGLARFCATHVAKDSPRRTFFVRAGNIEVQP